jgi:hypothetical protein
VTVTNDPYHYDDPDWSEPMTGDQRFCKCGHSRREHSVLLPRGVGCYRYNCICIDFEPKDIAMRIFRSDDNVELDEADVRHMAEAILAPMDPEISSPVKTAERVLAALAPKRRIHLEGRLHGGEDGMTWEGS